MSAEPKMHLYLPGNQASFALCGTLVSNKLTRSPHEATCKRCLGAYSVNVDWYWRKLGAVTPPSSRYTVVDIPIPGLVVAYKPNGGRTILV